GAAEASAEASGEGEHGEDLLARGAGDGSLDRPRADIAGLAGRHVAGVLVAEVGEDEASPAAGRVRVVDHGAELLALDVGAGGEGAAVERRRARTLDLARVHGLEDALALAQVAGPNEEARAGGDRRLARRRRQRPAQRAPVDADAWVDADGAPERAQE